MPKDDVEYFIDQDITVAPAEDIPLDGTGIIEDFDSFHKKHQKKYKRTKKKTVKKEVKKKAQAVQPVEEKPKPIKKPKKKKVVKETKVETKMETEPKKEPEVEQVQIRHESEVTPEVKPEPNNDLPNYDNPGGAKYFGITILIILIIIAAIFSIRYCGDREEIIQINDPSGNQVNIVASSKYSYNGYDFSQGNDGLWYTYVKIDPQTEYYVRLHHGPVELEKIKIEGDIDESFKDASEVYLTFNPEGDSLNYITLATGEIGTNFIKAFHIGLVGACTVNATNACEQRPTVTCETTNKPTIEFVESKDAKITLDKHCIKIYGEGEDLVQASEKLLYFLYGVMQR